MTFTDITQILDDIRANFVLLLCHHNADPDAVCSAYAFQSLLAKCRPNISTEIGTSQGISRLTKHIMKSLPINVNLHPDVEKADAIVLLDTNTTQQLGQLAQRVTKSQAPIIVVDHHATHPQTQQIAKICITNDEASSTCEIVYNFYKELNMKPDLNEA
jgi:phosphoesterase RecJ-like protein